MEDETKRILVVDDEPDERLYLATLFEDNGYLADMAKDGNEALEKARAQPPDLITLDITMPEKSGVRFFREARHDPALGTIPIVVVTGVTGLGGNPEEFYRFLATRKDTRPPEGFIAKPVDQQKLLETVEKLLA
ncbi:MAG: response regulator [Candidatus Abyssobacteria bacterium SURF_17]|jgi:CheY-like chemotaxis protein|uniref:Response regulator n=1 Tax=Candidatus Abyssobacteria bacterium SURF_17 TaxID=2093361 RepID=A0A419F357_9BACT|nr:MAG: response regulator [Candidatus Abyssubacteria bacterium SURF_17]